MKKFLTIAAIIAITSPAIAQMCVSCCRYWIDKAYELEEAGGYEDYLLDVLIPHIEDNCG